MRCPLKTLSLDFTRELTEGEKTEHIVGTLHYDAKTARVVVEGHRTTQANNGCEGQGAGDLLSCRKTGVPFYFRRANSASRLLNPSFSLHKRSMD